MKRSGERFPVECNLSLYVQNKRKMIVIFLNDITDEENQENALAAEKQNTEDLLLNIFPKEIALRVKNNESNVCEVNEGIGVLCTDMVCLI